MSGEPGHNAVVVELRGVQMSPRNDGVVPDASAPPRRRARGEPISIVSIVFLVAAVGLTSAMVRASCGGQCSLYVV